MTVFVEQAGWAWMRHLALSAIVVLFCVAPADAGVLINEIMAVNNATTQSEFGRFSDWIEIYNNSVFDENISGYCLSDETSEPAKWRFPPGSVIPSGGRVFVWADGTTEPLGGPPFHANFRLDGTDGEHLGLYAADGATTVDHIWFGPQAANVSFGRAFDGLWIWGPFLKSTPNAPNFGVNFPPPSVVGVLYVNEWMMRNRDGIEDPAGKTEDWVEIYNAGDTPIDLFEFHITDDLSRPNKWKLPLGNVVGPHGYIVLWADDDEEDEGPNHLSFGLKGSGEPIGLYGKDGFTPVDVITTAVITPQYPDISQGRRPDGGPEFNFFSHPTPREPNWIPSTAVRRWENY